ncbi:MAG: large conductance mechanosensitive channel protein MscL [Hyphomicrobiales bacterium]
MLNEFKAFILKGNVMDLAVGVIIGGAFGAITKSLIDDVIMPVVGAIFGGLDFSTYFAPLNGQTEAALDAAREGGAVLAYGSFITAIVNFIILGFIVFMLVKAVNNMMKKEEEAPAAPPAPTKDQVLLTEIRDALKKGK